MFYKVVGLIVMFVAVAATGYLLLLLRALRRILYTRAWFYVFGAQVLYFGLSVLGFHLVLLKDQLTLEESIFTLIMGVKAVLAVVGFTILRWDLQSERRQRLFMQKLRDEGRAT